MPDICPQQLEELLGRFQDVFSDNPGHTDRITHSIPTGDARPITQSPYRIPIKWKQDVDKEVDQLLAAGIITQSTSPWSSPIVCVPKKD